MSVPTGRTTRQISEAVRRPLVICIAVLLMLSVSGASAIAGERLHEGTKGAGDAATTVEAGDVVETVAPPTDVPPTDVPPTDVPPTEVPPTDVPPTQPPPTDVPTETPLPTETSTIEPTSTATDTVTVTPSATASPSPTATPAISWSLSSDLTCTTDAEPVESGGSIVYRCSAMADLTAFSAPDVALELAWNLSSSASSSDWTIDVRPTDDASWSDAGAGVPLRIIDAVTTESATDTRTLSRPLDFSIRLTRAACVTSDPSVVIHLAASLTAPGSSAIPITAEGSTMQEASVIPQLAAIPEPSISFLGPVTFGEVSLPQNEQVEVRGSSAVLRIDGLDRSCGVWTISVQGGALAAGAGRDLDASTMQLVAVNGQLAPVSPCGLDQSCLVAVISAGPSSLPSLQLELGFQVIVPSDAPLGELEATITATISQGTVAP